MWQPPEGTYDTIVDLIRDTYCDSDRIGILISTLEDAEGAATVALRQSEKLSEAGFDAVFRTWLDTRVARVRISWIAVGTVSSEDDWDVS